MTHSRKKGFTLLELLIVITILAILTLVVVLFINPVEILKKSRDVQRMSDLDVLRTGINLYLQDKSTNTLGGSTYCTATQPAGEGTAASPTGVIRTSLTPGTAGVTSFTTSACTLASPYCTSSDTGVAKYSATTTAAVAYNDGSGWIPYINFTGVRTGAPISKLPVDPINTGNTGTTGAGTVGIDSLYYRYACKTDNTFELDATLESLTYGPGSSDDKAAKDGGNVSMRYEVGTNLKLLPSSAPIL